MTIGRTIGGIAGGIVVAGATVAGVEATGHATLTGDALFAGAVAGYGAGALAGSAVATAIAGRRTALVVPAVLALLAAINLMSFAHPGWFAPAAVATLAVGWWAGAALGGWRQGRTSAA